MKAADLLELAKTTPILVGQFIASKPEDFPARNGKPAQVVENFAVLSNGETKTFKRYVNSVAECNPHKLKLGDLCVVKLKIREQVIHDSEKRQRKVSVIGGELEPLNN